MFGILLGGGMRHLDNAQSRSTANTNCNTLEGRMFQFQLDFNLLSIHSLTL